MRPFMGGGDMIREVTREAVTYNDPPMKFEAGTPGIVQQIGFGVALDYMMGIGMEAIAAHEADLRDYAMARLGGLNWLHMQGKAPGKGAIFQWNGEAWSQITDYLEADREVVDALIAEDSAAYAKESGITPHDCKS